MNERIEKVLTFLEENGIEYTLNQTIFEVKSRHLYYIDEAFAKLLQNQDFNYTDYVG